MRNQLKKTYKQFAHSKQKKSHLQRFFNGFLSEAVYRNTKIEHPQASRKEILTFLK